MGYRRARRQRVRRNADVDIRELERRAAEGDGEAAVLLLRAQAQAGQLRSFPEVNTTMAFQTPPGIPGGILNEWAGGTSQEQSPLRRLPDPNKGE